jgi:glycosyltransferase involved in cell wall biosynthesis
MVEQHSYRPTIPPVPEGTPRPLWSVMIPTYNSAKYLRETLASVLVQAPGPDVMQIMVVDDHSTQDDPEAVVKELGQGRVEFYQQPRNVGMTKNFQTCLELSRGYLIHQLHGDDCVKDGFYQKMGRAFSKHPEIGAAFCRNFFIDEYGKLQSVSRLEMNESGVLPRREWLEKIAAINLIQTPAIVVRREVYEQLGGFDHRFICAAEDWEMWVRIAVNYPIYHEIEPLALYRKYSTSGSEENVINGMYIQDVFNSIAIFQAYLPKEIYDKIYKKIKQNCAFFSLGTAKVLLDAGDWKRAIPHIGAALKYSLSYRVVGSAGRFRPLKLLILSIKSI